MTVTGSREALKRCPFCGVAPCQIPQNDDCRLPDMSGYYQTIWCENCGAEGGKRKTGEAAIEAWNTRASPDPAGVTLTVEEIAPMIERELDEMMMGVENYFATVNPKRAGHIRCALDRILSLIQKSVQPSIVTKPATSGTAAPVCELGGGE